MKPARPILRIKHGSHLYGTSTPDSDLDYKGIFLPSGRDILLGRVPKVIDKGTGSQHEKNSKDDVDDQSYPLQKFLKMVTSGDTAGTELLFAPPEFVELDSEEMQYIRDNKDILLNKQCKGFVGYCQRQAAKYGIKGSRMAACSEIVALLDELVKNHGTTAKLGEFADALEGFANVHEFSAIVEITGGGNKDVRHLEVVDRKIPYSATVKQALDVYSKVYENYGSRARAAKDNNGIDWKAVSHAVRVSRQAIELLSTGHITFPRPDAAELLSIKRGERDYNDVAPLLEALVEEVDAASKASPLPGKSDEEAIERMVLYFHDQQVRG